MNDAPYVMGCLHILTLSTRPGAFVHQSFGRYGIVYVSTWSFHEFSWVSLTQAWHISCEVLGIPKNGTPKFEKYIYHEEPCFGGVGYILVGQGILIHSAERDPHRGSCREEPLRIDDALHCGTSESGVRDQKHPTNLESRYDRLACGMQGTSVFA